MILVLQGFLYLEQSSLSYVEILFWRQAFGFTSATYAITILRLFVKFFFLIFFLFTISFRDNLVLLIESLLNYIIESIS